VLLNIPKHQSNDVIEMIDDRLIDKKEQEC
jgi:hypothetical protein